MEYQFYTDETHHEALVQYLSGLERDHAHHTTDLARYAAILATPDITPDLRRRMVDLQQQATARLHEVTHLLAQTRAQIHPDHAQAAFQRLQDRAAAQQALLRPPTP